MAVGCASTNTYPIDFFAEMHYSPSYKAQEPNRLLPADGNEVNVVLGNVSEVLTVPERLTRPYDSERAANLFAVNCAVCHGVAGQGDGVISPYLTTADNYYASVNDGDTYAPPPSLMTSREALNRDSMYSIISAGVQVMPAFSKFLAEEEIREIIEYIYDESSGLGT